MKIITTLLICFISICSFGQNVKNLRGTPKTVTESFLYFEQMFDDTAKYTFMTLPEDIATGRLHNSMGMWIRNNWRLWGNSAIKKSLIDSGLSHPDDMSAVLLKSYYRHLNNKPLNISEEVEKHNAHRQAAAKDSLADLQTLYEKTTSPQELLEYFPVGDTIVVNVYATHKKWFQTIPSSVRGLAVIKEHRGNDLVVEIISLQNKKKHTPEKKAGAVHEFSPLSCHLMPPKDWTVTENAQ